MMGLVIGLSLATWLFFRYESVPLRTRDTAVVVCVWILIVFGARSLRQRFSGVEKKR